jgi:hypothetical protein
MLKSFMDEDKPDLKKSKLSLRASIILAGLILGGFFYATQVSKQRSIERQQEIKRIQDCYDKNLGDIYYVYSYDEKNDICSRRNRSDLDKIFE